MHEGLLRVNLMLLADQFTIRCQFLSRSEQILLLFIECLCFVYVWFFKQMFHGEMWRLNASTFLLGYIILCQKNCCFVFISIFWQRPTFVLVLNNNTASRRSNLWFFFLSKRSFRYFHYPFSICLSFLMSLLLFTSFQIECIINNYKSFWNIQYNQVRDIFESDATMRQVSEAIDIRREGSSMNGKGEWNHTSLLRLVMTSKKKVKEKKNKKKTTYVWYCIFRKDL